MSAIDQYLEQIKKAVYGEEVRDAIYQSIKLCWTEGGGGGTPTPTPTPEPVPVEVHGVITPHDFGGVGDGITNDTRAVQDAIEYAIANKCILMGQGTYLVADVDKDGNAVTYNSEYGPYVLGDLNILNLSLKVKGGITRGLTSALNVYGSGRVTITGCHINGNRLNQSTAVTTQDGGMHGIRIKGTGRTVVNSCYVHDCYSDCILCGAGSKVTIVNTEIVGAGRNGVTFNPIIGVVDKCYFHDNGVRTAPMHGLHTEFDRTSGTANTEFNHIIKDSVFENNASGDYTFHVNKQLAHDVKSLLIDGCTMSSLGFSINSKVNGGSTLENIKIFNCNIGNLTLGNVNDNTYYSTIEKLVIDNCFISALYIGSPYQNGTYNKYGKINVTNSIIKGSTANYVRHPYEYMIVENTSFEKNTPASSDTVANTALYFSNENTAELTEFANCKFVGTGRAIRDVNTVILKVTNCHFDSLPRVVDVKADFSVSTGIFIGDSTGPNVTKLVNGSMLKAVAIGCHFDNANITPFPSGTDAQIIGQL